MVVACPTLGQECLASDATTEKTLSALSNVHTVHTLANLTTPCHYLKIANQSKFNIGY